MTRSRQSRCVPSLESYLGSSQALLNRNEPQVTSRATEDLAYGLSKPLDRAVARGKVGHTTRQEALWLSHPAFRAFGTLCAKIRFVLTKSCRCSVYVISAPSSVDVTLPFVICYSGGHS